MTVTLYQLLVYFHLMLFVLWLGADVGVNIAGQHFRKRFDYSLDQRLTILKLLVTIDMIPRSAWALMVPSSLSVLKVGGWWDVPGWLMIGAFIIGGIWLFLIWDAHWHDQTPRAKRNRRIELFLQINLAIFYIWLGVQSLELKTPIGLDWLATKALLFGLISCAAIMIDMRFRPVGPLLVALLEKGSSDATENPLLKTMNRSRRWVWVVYGLLVITSFLGNVKPF